MTENNAVHYNVHNTSSTEAENRRAAEFYYKMTAEPENFPISFALDGDFRHGFSKDNYTELSRETEVSELKRSDIIMLRHRSGLKIKLVCALYPKHAAYEWTTYFINDSESGNSPRINCMNAADIKFYGKKPRLRSILGDARNEFVRPGGETISPTYRMNNEPYETRIGLGTHYSMENKGGCACNHEFPYFAIQLETDGVVAAIGWPGSWSCDFFADREGVGYTAGQGHIDTYLKPGESIRTPLNCFMLYDGCDPDRQTNLWRRFFMECNMPRQNGEIIMPLVGGTTYNTGLMTAVDEAGLLHAIRTYNEKGVPLTAWWMDAGWYTVGNNDEAPVHVLDYGISGTWKIRDKDFPTHLKAVSDEMHRQGGKTILWFEPERCGFFKEELKDDGSTLKPEWLLEGAGEIVIPHPGNTTYKMSSALVNLGIPEAYEWVKERIFKVLREGDIDIYREDHNIQPANQWKKTDEPGRAGLVENKYITAHLKLWDEIRAEFGDMIIDSCASGGRRNDLESMRRAVPFHTSDFFVSDIARRQAVHRSLYGWFPYFRATGPHPSHASKDGMEKGASGFMYEMRSALCPFTRFSLDIDNVPDNTAEMMRNYVKEWESVNEFFYADYYPLLDWNIDEGSYIAWEFFDGVRNEGFLQVYRRAQNDEITKNIPLKGLSEDIVYNVRDLATGAEYNATGRELLTKGAEISIPEAPGATTVKISRKEA